MNNRVFLICLSLFTYVPAQAEVLDKFGGCRWPSSIWWLCVFAFAIGLLIRFKKRPVAKILFAFSGFYITVAIIWPFLAIKNGVFNWYDQATFDYYWEIQSCPQFELFGFWNSICMVLIIYLLVVLGLFFASRPSN